MFLLLAAIQMGYVFIVWSEPLYTAILHEYEQWLHQMVRLLRLAQAFVQHLYVTSIKKSHALTEYYMEIDPQSMSIGM